MNAAADPWPGLRADCARCAGLCCVVPAFSRSADFAIDKPAGRACPNLAADHRCTVHAQLRPRGFAGCTVFDCFGAGQQLVQVTLGGRDWRGWQDDPDVVAEVGAAFPVLRGLHELLRYLGEARELPTSGPLGPELAEALARTRELAALPAAELAGVDLEAQRRMVNAVLVRAADLARAAAIGAGGPRAASAGAARDGAARPKGPRRGRGEDSGARGAGAPGADLRGADLVGADLRRRNLRGASLRGALLIGANLQGSDLTGADLTGADLRGADLRGADLRASLFVVEAQLRAARGDAATRIPARLARPEHWPAESTGPGRKVGPGGPRSSGPRSMRGPRPAP